MVTIDRRRLRSRRAFRAAPGAGRPGGPPTPSRSAAPGPVRPGERSGGRSGGVRRSANGVVVVHARGSRSARRPVLAVDGSVLGAVPRRRGPRHHHLVDPPGGARVGGAGGGSRAPAASVWAASLTRSSLSRSRGAGRVHRHSSSSTKTIRPDADHAGVGARIL